jgi:hypothetical protein
MYEQVLPLPLPPFTSLLFYDEQFYSEIDIVWIGPKSKENGISSMLSNFLLFVSFLYSLTVG